MGAFDTPASDCLFLTAVAYSPVSMLHYMQHSREPWISFEINEKEKCRRFECRTLSVDGAARPYLDLGRVAGEMSRILKRGRERVDIAVVDE